MDFNKLFKKLFPTRERFDRYIQFCKQLDEEAIRQAKMQKQIDARTTEMIEMTTEHDDIDFSDEADDIWEAINVRNET